MEANFYVDFENKFRGSTDQIYEITSNYDGLIKHIIEIDDNPTLLDIGCGRGEWLNKCSVLGFEPLGVELNPQMAQLCRNMDIKVLEGDALNVLSDLPDNSFSLITVFHLIEHISFDSIDLLLRECNRLLKTKGFIILETPSIDNLSVASRFFHIDPTHINPINPDLLLFSMERIGFDMVQYFYINGGPLQEDDHDSLTRIFNGVAQDLMLIGTKSKTGTKLLSGNKLWKKSLKEGLSTIEACVEFDHRVKVNSLLQEQSINNLRQRIYLLEKNIEKLNNSSFLLPSKILSKIQNIIFLKLKNKKNKIYNFCLKCFRLMFSLIYKILNRVFANHKKKVFSIFYHLDKITKKFGYIINNGSLLKQSLKNREEQSLVSKHEKRLEVYYNSSLKAKSIFKDIND